MTFWETIERGEYVMFALAVLLIVIIWIFIARSVRLYKPRRRYPMMMQRLRDHVMEADLENARLLCEISSTPGARIIEAGINNVGRPLSEIREGIDEVLRIENQKMSAGKRWLRAIAVIAPLLGLGGTLVGIIDRLRDLGEITQGVDISMVCGSLAPTIVTTVAGLGVGILALFAIVCLDSVIAGSRRNLNEIALQFISLLNEPS